MEITGDGKREILIVGGAPGKTDDERGEQFVGESGNLLRDELYDVGIDLDRDCWKTNAIICRPPNRDPKADEVAACRPNLINAVKMLKPKVIIPAGDAAVDSLISWAWGDNAGKVGRWVGWTIPDQKLNAWICPTWSPSFVMKDQKDSGSDSPVAIWFRRHLEAAARKTKRPWKKNPDFAGKVQIELDEKRAAEIILCLARGDYPYVAIDYETDRLKPDSPDARIVSCAVAYGDAGKSPGCLSFPWHGDVVDAVDALWRSPVRKIASNKKFEQRWTLREFGHPGRNWWWDTMIDAHLLDNRPGTASIKFQVYVMMGLPRWDRHIEPFFDSGGANLPNRIHEIKIEDLLLYGGIDAVAEFYVAFRQAKLMGIS